MSLGPAYDAKQQIRQAIDIVDLVGSYVPLRRQGRHYLGLCPWHDDTRPSLQVNHERQIWRCWVCNIGGDIFNWMQQREGVEFREALEMLAERAGIELAPAQKRPLLPGAAGDKQTLYRAVAWAEEQFHQFLLRSSEAEPARCYIEERGITPASVEQFRIGFAPASFQWLLDRARNTAFSPQVLQAVGLAGRSQHSGRPYDFFRGRVIFPIRDTQRRVIAFGGRVLPEIAVLEERERGQIPGKYINSPETRLFAKSDQLYALEAAIDATCKDDMRHLVLVEGYTDVIMAHQHGLKNVVACCGTALNQRHIHVLRRFSEMVTLVLDGDEAGQKRTNQILELFVAADIDLRIITLPDGLDPFDYLREHGVEPFCDMLEHAVDALQHKIDSELRGVDVSRDTHRATKALESILATMSKAPRLQSNTTTSTQLREQQMLARLARQFHNDEAQLRQRLNELRHQQKRPPTHMQPAAFGAATQARVIDPPIIDPKEAELIEILILYPELTQTAAEGIHLQWLSSAAARDLFATFCHVHASSGSAAFTHVMTELEDIGLKNLLVQLEERAHTKGKHAQMDATTRLDGLIRAFADIQSDTQQRETLALLEAKGLDEQEELDVLKHIIEQQRSRRGISAPTDGQDASTVERP